MRLPRNAQIWLPGLIDSWRRRLSAPAVTHVWLVITDHFEPYWGRPTRAVATERVSRWVEGWPKIAARHRDDHGRPPQYSFFYPEEEYDRELLSGLAGLTHAGIADVEVHLHHDGEGEANFRERVSKFTHTLHDVHSLLRMREGVPAFAFIHGNWALDNSHPDGKWCGLNNELTILQELGCYADFTLPAAPSPCQTRIVNSIYRAVDDPDRPRSHDTGTRVTAGSGRQPGLLMVQGPLTVRRHQRKRWMPSVEVAELSTVDPATPHRVRRWLAVAPRVGGHMFIKLHTHGAQESIMNSALNDGLDNLFKMLSAECQLRGVPLGYLTAYQCATAIESLALGLDPLAAITA